MRRASAAAADLLYDRRVGVLLSVAGAAPAAQALPDLTASEWACLLEAAECHGLTPLLHRFAQPAIDRVPPDVAHVLAARYRASAKRGLAMAAWLSEIIGRFDAASIPVIVLKGPPLAQTLYADPALRPSFDLDLLVHPSDLQRSLDVLSDEGYARPPHLARFSERILLRLDSEIRLQDLYRTSIDVHWEIAPADYPFRIDPDFLWRARASVPVAGRSVPVITRECLLVYLAAHGAKHIWTHLVLLSDIARLLNAPLDWAAATRLAAESGCTRVVRVALLLAHGLLGAPVPADAMTAARNDAPAVRAAADVSERLRRLPARAPSIIEGTAFNARLATDLRAKVRHWAAIVITPKHVDLARWRLPDRLLWLYRPLRVRRLIGKYGRKLVGF